MNDPKFDADSAVERAKYLRAYQGRKYAEGAGKQSYKNRDQISKLVVDLRAETAWDFGCGNGLGAVLLYESGIEKTYLVDFMGSKYLDPMVREMVILGTAEYYQNSLWDPALPPQKADFGICTDVMEHIPEQHVDEVLRAIRKRVPVCFFRIAMFPDSPRKIERHGGALHVTVREVEWWIERLLRAFGTVTTETVEVKKTNPNKRILVCTAYA